MYKQSLILGTATLIVAAIGFIFFQQVHWATANSNTQASPTLASTYDPAQYGLPGTIAGYKVLAVLTSDNTACMPPGEKEMVLQASQPTVEEYLKTSDIAGIKAELVQKGFPEAAQWGYQITGPGTTVDGILSGSEDWNTFSQKYGCVTSGPAATPAPTP